MEYYELKESVVNYLIENDLELDEVIIDKIVDVFGNKLDDFSDFGSRVVSEKRYNLLLTQSVKRVVTVVNNLSKGFEPKVEEDLYEDVFVSMDSAPARRKKKFIDEE